LSSSAFGRTTGASGTENIDCYSFVHSFPYIYEYIIKALSDFGKVGTCVRNSFMWKDRAGWWRCEKRAEFYFSTNRDICEV
jgi:hypothetical protein